MKKIQLCLLMSWVLLSQLYGQELTSQNIKELAKQSLSYSLTQYRQFLNLPNIGRDATHRQAIVDWCVQTFNEL